MTERGGPHVPMLHHILRPTSQSPATLGAGSLEIAIRKEHLLSAEIPKLQVNLLKHHFFLQQEVSRSFFCWLVFLVQKLLEVESRLLGKKQVATLGTSQSPKAGTNLQLRYLQLSRLQWSYVILNDLKGMTLDGMDGWMVGWLDGWHLSVQMSWKAIFLEVLATELS